MGSAMIKGWTSSRNNLVDPNRILIIDPNTGDHLKALTDLGCQYQPELDQVIAYAEYVLLAIKPQIFAAAARQIARALPERCAVISVLAGTTMAQLQEAFPAQNVIRAMPNTPAAIGKGITAFYCERRVSDAQKETVKGLLSASGQAAEVDSETAIDMVTAVSGSGPAYFFHMVEALEAAAIKIGLPEDIAPEFARQTLIGAGALLEQSGQSAKELRRGVTSPNGTTQAALDVLMGEPGLPSLMRETVQAAFRRAKELGKD